MSLESVFRLSLIMNMVDNLTEPMGRVTAATGESVNRLQRMEQSFGSMAKTGIGMAAVGQEITGAVLAPVEATFETRRALGELSSLGIQDLDALESAARSFSDQWAGTSKADFITAAYDIKSGIASLSDEGVAQYTNLAGVTAKATKASIGEMTDLFATGYGIYKGFYDDLSDMEFGEMFSAGISESVRAFKTSGSGMAQAIKTLGASATTAQVPLEEQLAILGSLQATMSGSEAGTKYKAFLRSAAKGGEALGLSFTDANNQLLSMPEILEMLRGKFGETMDAAEKMELQKAFGDTEAVALIDLMYNKTGDLQDSILSLYSAMGDGMGVATDMANAINETEPEKFQRLQQQIHNVTEDLGNSLLPAVNVVMEKVGSFIQRGADWIQNHQTLVKVIMLVVFALGGFLTVAGTAIAVVGGVGLVFTKTAGMVTGFIGTVKKLPGMLDTIRLYGMYAGDGIKKGFSFIKSAGPGAISSVKNVALNIATMAKTAAISGASALKSMALGLVGMAKQALATAATALGPLISSVWSFTAALLANPITWVVIGIVALIAGIVLLYNKCEWFRNLVDGIFGWVEEKLGAALGVAKTVFGAIGNIIGKVMGAAKATVEEKLGNMKRAYEEHGGGIKGIAAAAIEGVKGFYTAGFTFLDNLTGGKLSAMKDKINEKFGSMKETVSSAMEATKQYAAAKLSEMQSSYEQHGGGMRGAMAAAMTGIRSVAQDGFNFVDSLTGGKLSSIRDKFGQGIQGIKDGINNSFAWFRESGAKILTTFTEGIQSAISAPAEAIKGGLQKIRNMLPFSDAKEGPLSTLTLSGQRTMTTYATGLQQGAAAPVEVVGGALAKINTQLAPELSGGGEPKTVGIEETREPVRTVERREVSKETSETSASSEKEKGVTIKEFHLTIDFSKLKELPMLLKFLREIEDYANANGLTVQEEG